MATAEEEKKLEELSKELHGAVYNTPMYVTGASEHTIKLCQARADKARKEYREYRASLDNPQGRYNPF